MVSPCDVSAQDVKILALEVDNRGADSTYRILLNKEDVKFVWMESSTFDIDVMCFPPRLTSQLPPFPDGDWNVGRIAKDRTSDKAVFEWTRKDALPTIECIWHSVSVNYLDLTIREKLRSNVYEVEAPRFPLSVVIAKMANYPWEIACYDQETEVYSWIDRSGICPRFLGHITEGDRTIGFLLEKIGNGARHAGIENLAVCEKLVARLHGTHGILHGDLNRHNILVSADGSEGKLVDFENATKCSQQEMLQEEMGSLVGALEDDSGKGGVVIFAKDDF